MTLAGAKGTPVAGIYPEMKLYVNGTQRGVRFVTASLQDYSVNTPLTGNDVIDVVYTNDACAYPEDRNLHVDYIRSGTNAFDNQQVDPGYLCPPKFCR